MGAAARIANVARVSARGAGLVGGLGGGMIALAHVAHTRGTGAWDACVLLAASVLLYGAVGAAVFGAVGAALLVTARGRAALAGRAAVAGGLAAFAFVFGWLFANWGLTYDELPGAWPAGPAGMLAWLGIRTAAIGLAGALAGALVAPLVARADGRLRAGRVALAGGVLAAMALALGLAGRPPTAAAPAPVAWPAPEGDLDVVLVGIDGADWRVLTPLLEAGRLPHLAALVAEGASGPLATLPDANSAVIWASLYTGAAPERHGIHDFFRIRLPGMTGPGVYPVHRTWFSEAAGALAARGLAARVPVDRRDLAAVPLWEVVSGLGLSVGVVDGWYYTFPAPARLAPGSFFVAYGADAERKRLAAAGVPADAAAFAPWVAPPDVFPEVEAALVLDDLAWQRAATLALLERHPQPRFLNVYTHEPDSVQHATWSAYEPGWFLDADPDAIARDGGRIPAVYEAIDAFLGALRSRLGPRTVLLVVSDHGNAPTLLHAMDTQHRHGPPGVILMAGPPVRAGLHLADAHVLDVAPTVLHLLGLPVPDDADGRVLTEALAEEFVAERPIRSVTSYAGLAATTAAGHDPERDRLEMEKLRALGYVN